jgi:hypothetical protein
MLRDVGVALESMPSRHRFVWLMFGRFSDETRQYLAPNRVPLSETYVRGGVSASD